MEPIIWAEQREVDGRASCGKSLNINDVVVVPSGGSFSLVLTIFAGGRLSNIVCICICRWSWRAALC